MRLKLDIDPDLVAMMQAEIKAGEKAKRGLDEQVVREISAIKGEPEWMLAKRLKAYSTFERKPMPMAMAMPRRPSRSWR